MAVLTCYLCDQPAYKPIPVENRTFCCHGCRDLWRLLGDEQLAELKSRPGINWRAAQECSSNFPEASQSFLREAEATALNFHLGGLWCASCGILIEQVVRRLPGVLGIHLNYTDATLEVALNGTATTASDVCQVVSSLGYEIQENEVDSASSNRLDGALVQRFFFAAGVSLLVMMASVPIWSGYLSDFPRPLRIFWTLFLWVLTTPIVFWAGWPFLFGAWNSIRHRIPTMDLLISIASLAAYAYSVIALLNHGSYLYFDTSGFLVTFLLLGRLLEMSTQKRASAVTRLLADLTVKNAVVHRNEREQTISVNELVVGDVVIVRPGARIPVDGRVEEGQSAVDESFLTGESMSVDKTTGDPVYAGSTNHTGRLIVRTTHTVDKSILTQTLQSVRNIQANQGAYQRLINRLLRWFVPGVLLVSAATFSLWHWIKPIDLGSAILHTLATLVIACPCALSIAAPVASHGAIQTLGSKGILLRGDEAIERAAKISVVVFDKTGTLTSGQVQLTGFYPDDPTLLQFAASAELGSEHPLGRAVVKAAQARGLPFKAASNTVILPGKGIAAIVERHDIRVERGPLTEFIDPKMALEAARCEASGETFSVLYIDGRVRAILRFRDTIRSDALAAVTKLREAGIKVHFATGDHDGAARQVAKQLAIENWCCRMTPVQKAEYVASLRAHGQTVAYVGDGINDAAAMMQADLGIAMGSGTDVAIQAGHLVLTRSQLSELPNLFAICHRTLKIIRQNFIWAIGYNSVALLAALFGYASPAIAAAAMVFSSLFVLGNSLRIVGGVPIVIALRASLAMGLLGLLFVLAWFGI